MSESAPSHCVAVIGGAVAGAEMAKELSAAGAEVVVFEMNPRPFGKIEDGLPRWHKALREKEYARIRDGLGRDGVLFVPSTRVGEDVDFDELVEGWGFSGVVLANGAWRDRPVPVEGIDDYVGKGLIYQNPFIIWFNHADDPSYDGPTFEPEDGGLVVGGGLASIDVIKVLMVETTRAALAARGIEETMLDIEHKGIPKALEAHGLTFEELGLKGATLFYRRGAEDMPLMGMPEGADDRQRAKVRNGRKKILDKAMRKYCFDFEPLCMPDSPIVEGDQMVGLRFRRTKLEGRRVVATDETFDRRGPYVISSIGSIPSPIKGIPMKGELFAFIDWDLGRLEGYPTVFATGNVATGKGNIVASRKHAKVVAQTLVESFLGLDEGGEHKGEELLSDNIHAGVSEQAKEIAAEIVRLPRIDAASLASIHAKVKARHDAVGYDGFESWLDKHPVS